MGCRARSLRHRRGALVAQAEFVDRHFREVSPQVCRGPAFAKLLRQLRLVSEPLAGDAPIDPLPQARVHLDVEQAVVRFRNHFRPGSNVSETPTTDSKEVRVRKSATAFKLYYY